MNLDQHIERIEAYLEGQLSAEANQAFEAELNTNTELRQAYDLYRLSLDAVEVAIADDLRSQMKVWDEESAQSAPASTLKVSSGGRRWMMPLAAAASIALIIGFATTIWLPGKYSDSTLASGAYELPTLPTVRGAADEAAFQVAYTTFAEKDYTTAAHALSAVPATNNRYLEARYFLGHAYYQSGDFAAAITAFDEVSTAGDPRYSPQAQWYSVLSKLAAHQTGADFTAALQAIAGMEGHPFRGEAVELQEKLNSYWRKD